VNQKAQAHGSVRGSWRIGSQLSTGISARSAIATRNAATVGEGQGGMDAAADFHSLRHGLAHGRDRRSEKARDAAPYFSRCLYGAYFFEVFTYKLSN